MKNYNKVILMGNLTKDPVFTESGSKKIADISIAINREWNSNGVEKKEVSYFDCVAYGDKAKTIKDYLRKGRCILIEGRLKQDRWDDAEGKKQRKVKVIIEQFEFMDSKKPDTIPAVAGAEEFFDEDNHILSNHINNNSDSDGDELGNM